jgi:dihydroorotase
MNCKKGTLFNYHFYLNNHHKYYILTLVKSNSSPNFGVISFATIKTQHTMKTLIINAKLINEGKITETDVLINGQRIEKIAKNIATAEATKVIDAKGKYLMAGIIDDQVHFREPGLTHKANIYTEAKAAVAGGVTTFMEMPNTVPNALTQELLADKYAIAAQNSLANYSFFMGVSNDNLEEALKTDQKNVCGLKIFMGSSTGNMLVDNQTTLENVFSKSSLLIATHCEDEGIIRQNSELYRNLYGENVPQYLHPAIRNEAACLKSSSLARDLAKKYGTRLHILHITTEEETNLFDNTIPLKDKKITSEVCVHHLAFNSNDYYRLGSQIKCNPAVKEERHQKAIFKALLDDKIDIIATDHAPHTWEEKQQNYWKAPSGVPLVQHSLQVMLGFHKKGSISLEKIVEKMCHAPAICFQVAERGFVREGYFADLVLFDLEKDMKVTKENIYYKCNWSPFENESLTGTITHTFVSGHLVFENGKFDESKKGERITFDR